MATKLCRMLEFGDVKPKMKSDDSDHVITIGQYLLFYKSIPLGCDMGATHGITLPFDWAVF